MKKYKKPGQKDGWYEIHPTDAKEILDLSEKAHNRKIKKANVGHIVLALKHKKWKPNGQPIIFDIRGIVIDGQHRLLACVESGIPILSYCIWLDERLTPGLWATYDQGTPRGIGAFFSAYGIGGSDYNVAASMVAKKMMWDEKQFGAFTDRSGTKTASGKRSKVETAIKAMDTWGKDEDNWNWCLERAVEHKSSIAGLVAPSAIGFICYQALIACSDRKMVKDWADGVATGTDLSSTDPRLVVRNRIVKDKTGTSKIENAVVIELLIKSWNAHYKGAKVTKFQSSGLASVEFEPTNGKE